MTRKEIIKRYAKKCINDEIPSCVKHKWACERALKDFQREANDPYYPYFWDEEAAELIVSWFKNLRHSKGELAGQPINLTEWQQFHLCQLYGWKRKKNGRRRFKKMFIEVSRKNAKSQELAGICLMETSYTSTKNGELCEAYTAGVKSAQSKIVFNEASLMLKGSKLRPKFKITRSRIEHIKTGSFIRPLSKDDGRNGSGDGTNPSCLVVDEYHAHPTSDFVDLSIGSNTKEPLLCIITTAGVDLNAPCYREYEFCGNVLNPDVDIEDEEYLIDICEQDKEEVDDPRLLKDEKRWIKSNPIRATYPEGIEKIRTTYEKALKVPEDMPMCLTKNFDIWVQAKAGAYMDMSKWKRCEVQELPVDIRGLQCVIGVDMSAKIDLTSVCFVIPYQDENEQDEEGAPVTKYIILQHSFIPNRDILRAKEITDKFPYTASEMKGELSVTDSEIVNQKKIMLWALDKANELGLWIYGWACDPWNSAYFMTELSEKKHHVFDVSQTYGGLSEATKAFRDEVYQRHILYQPDSLLNFCMRNCVEKSHDGKIMIDKDRKTRRIDIIDAVINAFKIARYIKQDAYSKERANAALDAWMKTLDAL